jgi:hypothetical protein
MNGHRLSINLGAGSEHYPGYWMLLYCPQQINGPLGIDPQHIEGALVKVASAVNGGQVVDDIDS